MGFQDKKPQHQDSGTKTPLHRETETTKPRHCIFKTFSEDEKPRHQDSKTDNHKIEIPRPKSHDIKFLWNFDPYAS